ncbi:Ig-like domain-containing protein [Vallitalea guaymasensis]|uniref:Ig-like domain-containing protein n=1 Tax=Vallitalea guaymasensis TaxID=1185412 RepID=UPI000DE4D0E1|nr:Ig-like domain-containing protein [Vallitalea guaymasensis]
MKNLKKVCALVLSLAMIVSTFTVSFAAEDTKTDAEICEALGMLQGEGDGVTDEYLAKSTTRFQAALMFLRLQDLEEEALAFEGTETFEDAEDLQWVVGRSVLAYLKANPELGWVGTGKGFKPNDAISAQAYYKVMLEALGYKYGEDFEWAEVLEFAAEKGLVAAAEVENFTNNDIATVTVETLKAENSEGVKLINVLVEKEVISEELAKLVDYVAPVTATMVGAKAIDATTITVTFDEAVEVDADDFAVTAGDKEFAVSEVTSADAGKVAVLTVEELTVGSKYTVTNGEESKTVVPTIKDDKTKPAISAAEAITGAIVRVKLDSRNINKDTLVAENFSLNNDANVIDVKLDTEEMKKDGNQNKTIVLMDVTGLKAGKAFKVTSNNVASYEGAVADDSTATFAGKDADDKAPKLAGAVSEAGYQVIVTFTEDVQLDEETATDIANYTITPELAVKDAKIEKNVVGGDTTVRLTTDFQKSGVAYTLKVDNISDGTNVMKEAEKVVFAGKDKADNQKANTAVADDATKVTVTFEYETNETALDVSNYSIDKDITVISAEYKEDTAQADKLDQKKVVLTTSEMKSGNAYVLTVGTGVQDILGQGLKESTKLTFAGKDKDDSFSTSNTAKSLNKNEIELKFGEEVDTATATDVANYAISDLGYPSQVNLDSTNKIATLTVQDQTAGKEYTITINNVKDKAGNVIKANTKVTFTGTGDIVDSLKVTGAEALTTDKIKVNFNQNVTGNADADDFVLTNKSTSDSYTFDDPANITTPQNYIILTLASGSKKIDAAHVYDIKINDADKHLKGAPTLHEYSTKATDVTAQLVGTDSTKAQFEIAATEVTDQTHIKITFKEVVEAGAEAQNINIYSNDGYSTIAKNSDNADICSAKASDTGIWSADRKSVVLTTEAKMENGKVYYVEFSNLASFQTEYGATLKEYENNAGKVRFQVVTGTLSAATDTKLDIVDADMKDKNTLEIKFNVDTNKTLNTADVRLVKADNDTTDIASVTKVIFTDEKTAKVFFTGDTALDNSNGIHYVYIEGTNLAAKVGGSTNWDSNARYASFAKVTTENAAPKVTLVEPLANSLIKVTVSEPVLFDDGSNTNALDTNDEAFVIYNEDTQTPITASDYTIAQMPTPNDKEFYITLNNGVFVTGGNYRIGFKDEVVGIDEIVTAKEYVTTSTDNSMKFGGTATMAEPTATLSTNTIVLAGANTIKYTVADSATIKADVVNSGSTYTTALTNTDVEDGKHISIVAIDTAGNITYADYTVAETTPGTINSVTKN